MIKKINVVHKGNDYIKVEFEENGKVEEVEITGVAVAIIEVLCKALHKPFPEDYKFED